MPTESYPPVSFEHTPDKNLFLALGGRDGCHRLANAFYAYVMHDPILRPPYPAKLTGCPERALATFLTQFLGGPYDYEERRWSMSLHMAHQRFAIGPREREAWLVAMFQAIDDIQTPEPARSALRWVFIHASAYLINQPQKSVNESVFPAELLKEAQNASSGSFLQQDMAYRWEAHQTLEQVIIAIDQKDAEHALHLLEGRVLQDLFRDDRAAFLNPLALLSRSKQSILLDYVERQLIHDPTLVAARYMGERTLLHEVAGQSNLRIVALLLHLGADPNAIDQFGHTPLYCVSNAYPSSDPAGALVAAKLVQAGADVNAREKIKHCSALHMAARRGNVLMAQALLGCGADMEARDKYGDTPLHRAVKCRQVDMVAFLLTHGADALAHDKGGQTPQQVARGARILAVFQVHNSPKK